MRKILLFLLAIQTLAFIDGYSQSIGDTIVVQGFNYNSTTRDSIIQFPTDTSLQFEKVIMLYSMRCKDGLVSTGTQRNKGCGEWDYSCNTYLTDSSHVDSLTATHPEYTIGGFSGSIFNYVAQPTYNMFQTVQQNVALTSITTEDTASIGTGVLSLSNSLNTAQTAGRSQILFTQSELVAAGLTAGNIDALSLEVSNAPEDARFMRIRIAHTSKTSLDAGSPDLSGFTEVFYQNTSFNIGTKRFQFYTPFNWNGTSNLLVEFSFTNKSPGQAMSLAGDSISPGSSIYSAGDMQFDFNGSSFILANNYKGVGGDTSRTIEAWIKTTGSELDIVYYGNNAAGKKYRFWINGSGQLRTEVNSGYAVGTTPVNDGQWHHVAMVQSGTSTNQISFYIDGVADNTSTVGNYAINTDRGWNVRIGQSVHNKPFVGQIADVRIWKGVLGQSTIDDWRYKIIDAAHPNYGDLNLYYPLNDNNGSSIADASVNGRDASVINGAQWSFIYGIDHFKNWREEANRPNISFYQGTYNLSVTPDTITDSIANHPNLVTKYQVYPKPGTIRHDSIGAVLQTNYWQAVADSLFDPNGNLVTTFNNPLDGSIMPGSLTYWQRHASKFEIMSFVTPYGIGLDLGMGGKTWLFDLTDFSPVLTGNKRMSMERGGQWQEDIDIKFLFIVGTPPRDVLDIQQIWRVGYESYTKINNNTVFEPRDVPLRADGGGFKIRSAITGHGQEGEFIPRTHYVNLDGGSPDFSWQVWKECAMNPVYPQGGTWIYDRAGWCPGMATDVQEFEISPYVTAGQDVEIDYSMSGASGTSNYIVSHQLVSYGDPNFATDAAIDEILNPTDRIEYQRTGTICEGPVVRIKNSGSGLLTSLTITYWVNNNTNPEVFNWTGNLGFLETEEVNLPIGNLWDGLSGMAENTFHVSLSQPNGGNDEYSYNNEGYSTFELPEVFPNKIYFYFRTNNAANENSYKVFDAWGNVVFNKNAFSNNNLYFDTLDLPDGCYTLQLDDTGDDGIAFWANNDGNGFFRIFDAQTNTRIYTLQPDFGGASILPFTVNSPLSYEELHPVTGLKVYPNPTQGKFVVEADATKAQDWNLTLTGIDGKIIWQTTIENEMYLRHTKDVSHLAKGMYFLEVLSNNERTTRKLVIN